MSISVSVIMSVSVSVSVSIVSRQLLPNGSNATETPSRIARKEAALVGASFNGSNAPCLFLVEVTVRLGVGWG